MFKNFKLSPLKWFGSKKTRQNRRFTEILDKVINISIFLNFFLIPLFFLGLSRQGVGFEKVLLFGGLTLVGVAACLIKALIKKQWVFQRTFWDWPFLALLAIYFLATIFSVGVKDSFLGSYGNISQGFLIVFLVAAFYYLVVNNFDLKKIKFWYLGLVISAALVVWYSLIQVVLHAFYIMILPGLYGSYLNLVIFLLTFLPLFLVTYALASKSELNLSSKNISLGKTFLLLTILGELVLFFLLKSFFTPTFWLLAGLVVLIILSLFLAGIVKTTGRKLYFLFAVFIVLIIFSFLSNLSRFGLDLPREASLSLRASAEISGEALKNDFFLGSGPSTFYYDFSRYKSVSFNQMGAADLELERPAGSLFNWLATLGILGTVAWLIVVLGLLFLAGKIIFREKRKQGILLVLAPALSFLTLLILSFLTTLNNANYLLLYLFLVWVAFSSEWFRKKTKKGKEIKFSQTYLVIFVSLVSLALFLVLFLGGIKNLVAEFYASQVRVNDLEKRYILEEKATSWFSWQDEYYRNLADYGLSLVSLKASQGDEEEAKRYLRKSLESAYRAVSLAPHRASNQEMLASAYENLYLYSGKGLAQAEHYYQNYQYLNPRSPSPYLELAWINSAKSRAPNQRDKQKEYLQEVLKKYDQALERLSNLPLAYYGKALVWEDLGKTNKAKENLKKAREISPQNPDYSYELGRLYFNQGLANSNFSLSGQKESSLKDFLSQGNISLNSDRSKFDLENWDSLVGGQPEKNLRWNQELRKSEEYFQKSLEINQLHLPSLYSLALLYSYLGEEDSAKQLVKKTLDNLDNEDLRKVIQEDMSSVLKK